MGLFDKVLKNVIEKASETVDKVQESGVLDSALAEAKNVFADAKDAVEALAKKEDAPAENTQAFTSYEEAGEGESGFSWGPTMPAEPNQFNYGGPWQKYFAEVFEEYFPQYEIRREDTARGAIYMFRQGGRVVLYVEVMDDGSEANSFRTRCRKEGIRYVRFYNNHRGWWNTKEYVYVRVREALEK